MFRRKRNGWLLFLFFILILMASTNPAKTEYVSWIKEQALAKSDGFLETGAISLFGDPVFDSSTTSNNYVFFSVFTTDLPGSDEMKIIGLFHNFIPLQSFESGGAAARRTDESVKPVVSEPKKPNSAPASAPAQEPVSDPVPVMKNGGTVKVIGEAGTFELPFIGVSAIYGISGDTEPSILPSRSIPDLHFDLPAKYADQLAVYWVNTGEGDNSKGLIYFGPHGWKAKRAGVGANGSTGFTLVSDLSSEQPQSISYRTDGFCFGCAVTSIGSYFPDLNEWANETFSLSEGTQVVDGLNAVRIDEHTVAYSIQNTSEYETNGVAVERHDSQPFFFGNAEITNADKGLATTLLNIYLQQMSQIRN